MITCPNCGTENRAIHTFCTKCGHSLATASPSAPQQSESYGLPAWLQDTPTTAASAPEATVPGAEETPQWLAHIGVEEASPTDATLPEWLREPASPPPTAEAAQPAMAATSSAAASELPPWLQDDQHLAAQPKEAQADTLPAWLLHDTAPAHAASQALPPVEANLPDWLRDAGGPASSNHGAAMATAPTGELPAWLQESQQPAVATQNGGNELPTWLHETPPPAPIAPASAGELPDWLKVPAETTPSESPAAVPADAAEHALPEWLRVPTEQSVSATETAIPAPADELPDWLRNSEQPGAGHAQAPASTATNGLPDWLREGETPMAAAAVTAAVEEGNKVAPAAPVNDIDLPDWLRDTSPMGATVSLATAEQAPASSPTQSLPTVDNLPAWLHDATEQHVQRPVDAQAEVFPPATAAEQTNAEEEPQLGVPDWLNELGIDGIAETPAVTPHGEESRGVAPAGVPAVATDEHGLPEWLRESSIPAVPTATTQPLPTHDRYDLPAWLRDEGMTTPPEVVPVETHEGAQVQDAPVVSSEHHAQIYDAGQQQVANNETSLPAWLTGFDEPAPQSTTSLPSWLDEQPASTTAAPARAPAHEFLGNLDLPDWLHDSGEEDSAPVRQPMPSYLDTPSNEAPPAPVVPLSTTPTRRTITRTPQRLEAVALLQRLQVEGPAEPAQATPAGTRRWLRVLLLVVVLLIIVGAIVAVFFGQQILHLLGVA